MSRSFFLFSSERLVASCSARSSWAVSWRLRSINSLRALPPLPSPRTTSSRLSRSRSSSSMRERILSIFTCDRLSSATSCSFRFVACCSCSVASRSSPLSCSTFRCVRAPPSRRARSMRRISSSRLERALASSALARSSMDSRFASSRRSFRFSSFSQLMRESLRSRSECREFATAPTLGRPPDPLVPCATRGSARLEPSSQLGRENSRSPCSISMLRDRAPPAPTGGEPTAALPERLPARGEPCEEAVDRFGARIRSFRSARFSAMRWRRSLTISGWNSGNSRPR